MRLKKNIQFIILLSGVFAIGVAIGTMIPQILSYFVGAGGAITVVALLRDVVKDVLAYGKKPFIDYDVSYSVENTSNIGQHGGRYYYTDFFLMIRNKTRNTTAAKCKASVECSHLSIARFYAIWQISDEEAISIGKEESIKLFTRRNFGSTKRDFESPTESNVDIIIHTRTGDIQYALDDNVLNAKIIVSIQCTNGDVPPEPYIKTIKQIIESVKKQ